MAIWDLIDNLSIASRQLESARFDLGCEAQDSDAIAELASRRQDWLTPQTVNGYDPADFEFLSSEEQRDLRESIESFLAEARERQNTFPPTADRLRNALRAFMQIFHIIRPDKYADPDALRIGKQIEARASSGLPNWIAELKFRTGVDSTGEESIWIRAIVDDEVMEDPSFAVQAESARRVLFAAAQRHGGKRWPYISFRSRVDENLYLSGAAQ
jgi:hypothetical protein